MDAGSGYVVPVSHHLTIMDTLHKMFQNWTLREVAIILGLVGQLLVQTGVIVWWGSKLNTTVQQVVTELRGVKADQSVADEQLMQLRIRLAVQEALANQGTNGGGGGSQP